MITGPFDLLNRSVASREVRAYLDGLGPVERDDDNDELRFPRAGLSLIHEAGVVNAVFLHLAAVWEFSPWRGPLPLGLHALDSQAEVRRKLGTPHLEQPAGYLKRLRDTGPMDRFDRPEFSMAIDYDVDGERIEQIILMLAVAVPSPLRGERVH